MRSPKVQCEVWTCCSSSEGNGIDSEEALAFAFVAGFSPFSKKGSKKSGNNSDRKNDPNPERPLEQMS
jgi:hypothetical protein